MVQMAHCRGGRGPVADLYAAYRLYRDARHPDKGRTERNADYNEVCYFFCLMDIPMDLSLNGNLLIFKQHNWSWAI